MKKRLLALLLLVIMVVGMLPTTAFAAIGSGDASTDNSYSVTFSKDAFNMTEIKVVPVDGSSTPVRLKNVITSDVTLEGATFSVGDGSVDIADLLSGYGLLDITTSRSTPRYYYQYATWGIDGEEITSFTYEDVLTNGEEGLYIHYRVPQNAQFTVTAVDQNNKVLTTYSTTPSGDITDTLAQTVLTAGNITQAYYFDHAELRHKTDSTINAVTIDSIDFINSYYYVTTSLTESGRTAFNSSEWDVYFVYESAATLTLKVAYTGDAGQYNQIDGVYLEEGTYTYQIPTSGVREFSIKIGPGANAKVVKGNDTLFDSSVDGYEKKEYLLSVKGSEGDQTVTVTFSAQSGSYLLDYTHYTTTSTNYHGFALKLVDGSTGQATTLQTSESNPTIAIKSGDRLRIEAGNDGTNSFVPNAVVINGNWIALPWVGVDFEKNPSSNVTSESMTTDVFDSDGNRQATVTVTAYITADNGQISGSPGGDTNDPTRFILTFSNITNNLKITFINLTNVATNDARITRIDDGLTLIRNNTALEIGRGLMNVDHTLEPAFGYYVDGFYISTPVVGTGKVDWDTVTNEFVPTEETGANWWGTKTYDMTEGGTNWNKVTSFQQVAAISGLIQFSFAYDRDGQEGGSAFYDGISFTLGQAASEITTPAITEGMEPTAPAGKIFVGWSLYPEGEQDGKTIYFAGETIPYTDFVEAADQVIYSAEEGKATFTLYPVFQDETTGTYASYTVTVHFGETSYAYTYTTGLYGATLDRDNILALPEVAAYISTLSNVVLDGASSDSLVKLERAGNTFHLYYTSTLPVTVTFVSKNGFDNQTGNTVTGSQSPGSVMNVPTPKSVDSALFIGWSTLSADDTIGAAALTDALVPYQDTTYYAVYADNVTVRLYTYKLDGTGWREAQTYTLAYGQSLNDVGASDYVNDTINKNSVGREFTDTWVQDSPYSNKTLTPEELLAKTDFAEDTDFYADYDLATDMSVILDPNGGTWADGSTDPKTVEGLTYGYTFTPGSVTDPDIEDPGIPNAPDGKIFVGWSTTQSATLGSPSVSALGWVQTITGTVGGHDLTYHAIWASTTLDVTVNDTGLVYNGQEQTPSLTVRNNGQVVSYTEDQVEWSNNINAGTASLIVTVNGMKGYATFEIAKADISNTTDFSVATDTANYNYTGSQITPSVTVTDNRDGVASTDLEASVDFAVTYGENVNTTANSGGGTYTVIGRGNYTGTQTGTFGIVNTGIQLQAAPMPSYLYNNGNEPESFKLVVQDVTNNRVLEENTDYTLQTPSPGNWTIGTHTITVNPIGNYAGLEPFTVQCTIVGAATRLDVTADPVLIQGSAGNPTITVKAAGSTANLVENQDYTLSYQRFDETSNTLVQANDLSDFGMYVITATGVTGTAYEGATGVTNFARLTVSTEGGLSVTASTTVFAYDGTNHWDTLKNTLAVTADGTPVSSYTYTVETIGGSDPASGSSSSPASFDMTNAGNYLITVTGSDDYSGNTGTLYVYVTPRDIGDETITVIPDAETFPNGTFTAVYDGNAHDHPFTITDSGVASGKQSLTQDTDFVLDDPNHDSHTDAGVYPVTIRGTGNYTGYRTFAFTITPKPITVSTDLNLTYGYVSSQVDLGTQYNEAEENILGKDSGSVTVTLTVDSGLEVGEHSGALRGVLTGDKAANYSLDITSTVNVSAYSLENASMIVSPGSAIFNNQAQHPTVILSAGTLTLKAGTDYDLYYYRAGDYDPDNTDYGTGNLGADGMVTAGTYTILAVGKGNYSDKITGTYTILPANYYDVIVTIDADAREQTYTGRPITLTAEQLTVAYGSGETLESGKYTVSYLNNTNAGTATVTVTETSTGKSGSATFQILPKDLSDTSDSTITVRGIGDATYNGNAITPVPTITYIPSDGVTNSLVNNSDFHLTYRNNVQAGTATVVISGSGNYTGAREVTFQINYAPATLSFYTWTADGGWSTNSNNNITILYGSTITEDNATAIAALQAEISGYEFAGWAKGSPLETPVSLDSLKQMNSFSTDTAFYAVYTPKQVTVTLEGNSGTVVGDTEYTAAYGTVLKATATRSGYTFAGWSTEQSGVTVGDMSITVPDTDTTYYAVWLQPSLTISVSGDGSFVYNGEVQRPTITVTTSSGETLSEDAYTVTWGGDGIDAGTYGFTVTAKSGGDTGFGTYTIAPKSITTGAGVSIGDISSVTYTGSEVRPLVTISDTVTGKPLVLNEDFTVGYSNNTQVGQATVTISGIGNYTDTTTKNFTISAYTGALSIAPIPDQTYTGSEITINSLVVYDSNGNIVPASAYTAAYSDNIAIGTATVTVTGQDNYAGAFGTATFQIVGSSESGSSLTVTVTPAQAPVGGVNPAISVVMGTSNLAAEDYTLSYEVYSNGGWSTSSPLTNAATQLASAGMYRITATGVNNYAGTSGSAIFVRTPAETSTGGDITITFDGLESRVLTYNGVDQMSVVTDMKVNDSNDNTLTQGTHYTVSVTYNGSAASEMKNAGAYTVLVQGKGDYAQSSASATIYIQPKDINDDTVLLSGLDTNTAAYTGEEQKPTVTLTDSEYIAIAANTDYTVSYGSGGYTNAGTYTVTITGKGNYTGTRTATYTITPVDLTVSSDVTLTYGYTTVDLSKQQSEAAQSVVSGDNVVVNLYVEPGLDVNTDGHAGALKGYLSGADAQNYTLTISSKVIVNKADIDAGGGGSDNRFEMIVSPASGSFTGSAHTPTIIVTHNSQVLQEETDYTLTYAKADGSDVESMVDMGTYTITATGTGSYSGSITGAYEITSGTGGSTGGLTVALAENEAGTYTYTGSAITPEVKVTFNGTELAAQDYKVDYAFNTNVGQGVITVTGLGSNYQGMSGTITFTISPKSISSGDITVEEIGEQTYTGSAITPKPVVTDTGRTRSAGVTLTEGVDYYLTYSDNVQEGTATVTITGIGNYTGTTSKEFTISTANIGGGDGEPGTGISVAVYPSSGVFTGLPHSPNVVVTHEGMQLTEGEDYTLTYKTDAGVEVGKTGLVEVGTYVITVTGTGNYSGSYDAQYIITPASGGGGSILSVESIANQTYTGSKIEPSVTVTYNNQTLDATYYDVTYSANINVGQATVIVTGKAGTSYENMVGTQTFTILPKDITNSDITVANIGEQTYTGSAITPEPTITDTARSAALIQNADYTLSYASNVDVGTATITITGRGNYTGTRTVTFTIAAADVGGGDGGTDPGTGFTMDVYPGSGPYTGEKHNPVVVIHYNGQLLEEGTDYTLSYADAGDSVVTDSGMVAVGTYTITATGQGNYTGTVAAEYTITQADASKVLVIKAIDDVPYTGSEAQPSIVVTYNGQTLVNGQDYDVSYTGDRTNVGLVAVTVTGKGTYNGLSATAAFQITRKDIASENITVNPIGDQTYTGGYITPAVTVSDGDRLVNLTLNTDYTVEYAGNLNVGTATVTIRGIGNYTGTKTIEFQIKAADVGGGTGGIAVNVYPASGVFNGVAHSPAIIVTYGNTQLVPGQDYTVSGNENMVAVGAYTITVEGKGNYAGTTTATYTITPADGGGTLTIGDIASVTYNGTEQTPEITVTHNGTPLMEGTDYDVTYSNNTNAGLATVTVTGKNNYENMTGTKTFTILPKAITQNMVGDIADQIYTGSAIHPTVTVTDTDRDAVLVLNSDYTVAYGANVSGTGTVTVSGIGNYTGTVEVTFKITANGTLTVSGVQNSYTYTGKLIEPEVTVKDGTGRQLVKGTDYIVTYKDNLNVGTATVTVTGLGAYAGQTEIVTFRIVAKLLYLDVTVDPASAVYGDNITPTISVALDGTTLNETTDYTLTYQKYGDDGSLVTVTSMDEVGMYVITATGAEDSIYEGAMGTATFVRLPDGGTLTPGGGGLVDGSNVITETFDGQDHRSVLDGITITKEDGTEVAVTKTEVSYNGGTAVELDENYQIINAGIYTVTYTADEGTAYVFVVIYPKDINDPTVTVNGLGEAAYTYNGTTQTPDVSLTDSVYSITKDTDYTVVTVSGTDAGTYPVTIAGKGNYTGYRFGNFIINQKAVTVEGTENQIEYTYGYEGPVTLQQGSDYTVSGIVSGDESAVTVDVTVPAGLNAGTHTIPGQLSGDKAQNYTVDGGVSITVKPIETGGGNDGDGDGVIETTNGFTVTMTPTSGAFTGQAHNPTITVTYAPEGSEPITLVQDKDYTVTYLDSEGNAVDMIQVGAYTVRVEAIGNYSGSFDLTYTITQGGGGEGGDGDIDGDGNYEDGDGDHIIKVGGFVVSMSPYSGYANGQPHNPKVTVTFTSGDSTTTLVEDVDFTVAYYDSTGTTAESEMISVGTYTVRVTGIGNYSGNTFDLTYTILNTPSGGGGGGGGGTTTDPDDGGDTPSVMVPDETGVSKWLNTSDHMAYMNGYPGNLFGPNDYMTRAEAAQMFYNLLLEKDVPITVSFDDVADDAWYATAVNTLASLGFINGVGNNKFDPERPITRAEFAAIAMRFADLEVTGENLFPDVSPDDWFYEFVVGAVQYGWIQGYPNGNFGPYDTITRAEVTTMVNRMLGRSPDEDYVDSHQDTLVQFSDIGSSWAYYQIVEATNAHTYDKSQSGENWINVIK